LPLTTARNRPSRGTTVARLSRTRRVDPLEVGVELRGRLGLVAFEEVAALRGERDGLTRSAERLRESHEHRKVYVNRDLL
jgi:hypothetical protein